MALGDVERCAEHCVHDDVLDNVRAHMPEDDEIYDVADLFKAFGDSTRLRILFALFETEACVCDIAEALEMTQSAISHQLKVLKQAKLVRSRREGKQMIYSLDDTHVHDIIAIALEHLKHS